MVFEAAVNELPIIGSKKGSGIKKAQTEAWAEITLG